MSKPYIDTFQKGMKFYRSKSHTGELDGFWYAFNPGDTYGYGSITAEFELAQNIRLINILHQDFYNDYVSKLNSLFKHHPYNVAIAQKLQYLYPIGFTDLDMYLQYSKNLLGNIHQPPYDILIQQSLIFTQNRARCSISAFDNNFFEIIKIIYKDDCDGFYWPIKTPNILVNNYQHSELAIFDKTIMNFIQEVPRTTSGGTIEKSIIDRKMEIYNTEITDPILIEGFKKSKELIKKLQEEKEKERLSFFNIPEKEEPYIHHNIEIKDPLILEQLNKTNQHILGLLEKNKKDKKKIFNKTRKSRK